MNTHFTHSTYVVHALVIAHLSCERCSHTETGCWEWRDSVSRESMQIEVFVPIFVFANDLDPDFADTRFPLFNWLNGLGRFTLQKQTEMLWREESSCCSRWICRGCLLLLDSRDIKQKRNVQLVFLTVKGFFLRLHFFRLLAISVNTKLIQNLDTSKHRWRVSHPYSIIFLKIQ